MKDNTVLIPWMVLSSPFSFCLGLPVWMGPILLGWMCFTHYSMQGRSTNVHKLNLPASLLFKIQGIVHFVQQGDLLKMLSIGGCTV